MLGFLAVATVIASGSVASGPTAELPPVPSRLSGELCGNNIGTCADASPGSQARAVPNGQAPHIQNTAPGYAAVTVTAPSDSIPVRSSNEPEAPSTPDETPHRTAPRLTTSTTPPPFHYHGVP